MSKPHKPSRQYVWQQKQRRLGRCTVCGKTPIIKSGMCAVHYLKHSEYVSAYQDKKKEK